MSYSQKYNDIVKKHHGKDDLSRAWGLEQEVLSLLFEISYLQAEVNFFKGGSDYAV
jgi:hypothetical protein